jgi:beta-glucanase (GH16 family)
VVAAFNLAAMANDHENEEHQNLDLSGFRQSPVAMTLAETLSIGRVGINFSFKSTSFGSVARFFVARLSAADVFLGISSGRQK